MLSVARRNAIEVDVESLLCTLLDRIRRTDRGQGTQWSHVHVLYKAFTDCVRIIAIPLPDNILLALYHAAQAHLGIVGRRNQVRDGDEHDEEEEWDDDDDYLGGKTTLIKRTLEMIKDALHAAAEVAGVLDRPRRTSGDDAEADAGSPNGKEPVHVSAHRVASVDLQDLLSVDSAKMGSGVGMVKDEWVKAVRCVSEVQASMA